MNAVLEPRTIVEEIRKSRLRDSRPLSVFWVWVSTDRDDLARNLKRLRGTLALVPHVLRTGSFVHPDSVMNDVSDVLDRARDDIQALNEVAREQQGIDLVVVSRKELNLADTSSPIVLPEWFPVRPGHTATVRIEDLTWSAAVALSDDAAGLDDLRRILYEVDKALFVRLQASQRSDRRRTQSLWDLALSGRTAGGGYDEELERIGGTLEAIRNPTGYRPSASKNPTVVGRLWAYANKTAPDGLLRIAKALATALDVGEIGDDESLVAVLSRPSNRIDDAGVRWSLGLVVTLRIACQLVTAAAHADDYPRFSVVLLRSTSENIRRFLDNAAARLQRAPAALQAETKALNDVDKMLGTSAPAKPA